MSAAKKVAWGEVATLAIIASYNAFLLGGTAYLIGWQGWSAWWLILPLGLMANYRRSS